MLKRQNATKHEVRTDMQAEIITVGTELLLGDIVDSNSQFLSRELAAQGISVLRQSTVGDNTQRLSLLLEQALQRSDLVIVAGGLGPTQDDLTKETVCDVMHVERELHEESWRRIVEYFDNTGRELSDNNQKQAMLPRDCTVFPNDHGTAPGCAIEQNGRRVILLPGPPRELIPMFNDYVAPYLAQFSEGGIFSYTVGVFGMPESMIAERIADLMNGANPTVAPYAKEGEVVLRVTARAASEEQARQMCEPILADLKNRLGGCIYGVNAGSLQKAVVRLLKEKQRKIATAESCTAGLLSGRITEVPGASEVFECGVAAYSCEIKRHLLGVPADVLDTYGAVSPQTARAMAVGIRRVSHATIGVGITGVAGPEPSEGKPVGTVYIALADEKRVWIKKIVAGHTVADRDHVRHIAVLNALDLTRRYLEALPTVMAGGERIAEEETVTPVIPSAPPAGEKPDRRRRTAVLLGTVAILAALLCWLLFYILPPTTPASSNGLMDTLFSSDADNAATIGAPAGAPEGMLSDFYNLYSQNADVHGWLAIDNTQIAYPVMKRDDDPSYYQTHGSDGQESDKGALYFDQNAALFTAQSVNRSLVIYGSNPRDGSMFSDLLGYMDASFVEEHRTIHMNTLFERADWEVFGVMVVDSDPDAEETFDYTLSSFSGDTFSQFVEDIRERSLFTMDTAVTVEDRLLLLSTDASKEAGFQGARLVVAARRISDGEPENGEEKAADGSDALEQSVIRNERVLLPERWMEQTPVTTSTTRKSTIVVETTTSGGSSATRTATPGQTVTTTRQTVITTKKTTAKTTTTKQTPSSGSTGTGAGLQAGKIAETQFMQLFQIKDSKTGTVVKPKTKQELQTALARLVKMEMGTERYGLHSSEAWKAQAVAAYTYVIWYVGAYSTPYPFSFPSMNPSSVAVDRKIYDAVGAVLGVKILDTTQTSLKSMACNTMYFASSAGVTANCHKVFWGSLPYLQSVSSPYDNDTYISKYSGGSDKWSASFSLTLSQLKQYVTEWVKDNHGNYTVGYDQKSGQPPLYALEKDGSSRYVAKTNWYYVDKSGQKQYLTGLQLRTAIGNSRMRSHAFVVNAYDSQKQSLTITTYGYGHGVGMSQMGAVGYANEAGWNYQQILRHYYSITASSAAQLVAPKW